MTLSEILKQYVFLTDQEEFYHLPQKRVTSESALLKRLMAVPLTALKAAEVLESMRETGQPKSALKKERPSVASLIGESYEKLRAQIPLLKLSSKGLNMLFQVDSQSQVTQCFGLDKEKFVNLIVASPAAYSAVKDELENGAHSGSYGRLSLKSFCEALYDNFLMDPEKVLKSEPELISWSPEIPAYRVLDPAILKPGPTPNWDSFLARMDYPETFKAYVWSAFEPKNTGRQALWIRGEGSDGKSSAINAIAAFLGRDYVLSIGKGSYDKDFFFGAAFGKRLAVYMDCKNTYILKAERIKSLLGRDTVNINQKHEREFSAQVYSKLIVASNFHPRINYNDNSERTRLLLCEVATFKDEFGDPDFEYNLESELPAFLLQCKDAYAAQCPNNVNLKLPKSMIHKIKAACSSKESEIMEQFIEERLEFGEGFKVRKLDLHSQLIEYLQKMGVRDTSGFIEEDFARLLCVKGSGLEISGTTSYYNGIGFRTQVLDFKRGL
jgi:Family of unknown function (DUF5906)